MGFLQFAGAIFKYVVLIAFLTLVVIPASPEFFDTTISLYLLFSLLFLLLTVLPSKTPSLWAGYLNLLLFFALALQLAITRSILLMANAGNAVPQFGKLIAGDYFIAGFLLFAALAFLLILVIYKSGSAIKLLAPRSGDQSLEWTAKFIHFEAAALVALALIGLFFGAGIHNFEAFKLYGVLVIGSLLFLLIPLSLAVVGFGTLASYALDGTASRRQLLIAKALLLFPLLLFAGSLASPEYPLTPLLIVYSLFGIAAFAVWIRK